MPDEKLPSDDFRAFKAYMTKNWGRFSLWDGGCMMYLVSRAIPVPLRSSFVSLIMVLMQITIPDEGTVSVISIRSTHSKA